MLLQSNIINIIINYHYIIVIDELKYFHNKKSKYLIILNLRL